MHPFPPIENLPDFVGDEIAQVWLDPFGVQFAFSSGWRLSCENRVEQVEPNGTVWAYDCVARQGPPLILHHLLYQRMSATTREDFRLTFQFEDGSRLSVLSDLCPYECGQIAAPDGRLIVF